MTVAPVYDFKDDSDFTSHLDRLLAISDDESDVEPSHTVINAKASSKTLSATLAAANEQLHIGKVCKQLPKFDATASNHAEILSAALSAIVKLSRCCQANVKLRTEAEQQLQHLQRQNEALTAELSSAKERCSQRQRTINSLQTSADLTVSQHERVVKRMKNELGELQQQHKNGQRREQNLKQQRRRQQKEYTLLQQRVHTLIKARSLSYEPRITRVSNWRVADSITQGEEGEGGDGEETHMDHSDRFETLNAENDQWRHLLRAVMEEIDDLLIVSHPAESLEEMPSAPTEEQMRLPFEMLQTELEKGLEMKFEMLRTALDTKM